MWCCKTEICLAAATSQMRAVLSHDAVTMRVPSGLYAAENTSASRRRTAIWLVVSGTFNSEMPFQISCGLVL